MGTKAAALTACGVLVALLVCSADGLVPTSRPVMATGVPEWLATPSSGNLYSALTSKTGSGGTVVFSVSPALTTPNLGVASASSLKLSGTLVVGTYAALGTTSAFTESPGDLGQVANSSDLGTAPGAGACKLLWIPGSSSGHQLIARCGTDTTPVTVVDNVGN